MLVFTDTLEDKLEKINTAFRVIDQLFTTESIEYYATLPQAEAAKRKFAKEFCEMTKQLEAAKMQGFVWENTEYEFKHANGYVTLKMEIDEQTYKVLLARYRELFQKKPNKTIKGEEQKKRFVVTNLSDILRRFILDPADRARIIYAYQNEGVFLDRNVPEELPQEEEPQETPEEKEQRKEDNKLSFDEMKENIRMVVKKDLRRIEGMPLTQEVVSSFFNILTTNTLPNVDGVGFDLMKAMDELFGRREVTYIDKQVHSGNLSVKFEVYLKKLYYMLYGKEVKAREEGRYATLVDCIFAFPCLKKLKWSKMETEQRLSGYLDIIRNNRNSREGNGAHSAYLLSPEQLDSNIQAFVTLYLYVTGMCYNELKRNYEI